MLERTNEPTTREYRRRTLRYQKHRLPRKSPIPISQRLLAWLMMILTVALAVVMIGQQPV